MKLGKIAHLSDIHLRKIPTRNTEYEQAFENLYESLRIKKPDRIVIVGDVFNDFIDLQGEQLILAKNFLNSLAAIAPVRITRGNHDVKKSNLSRIDSIEAIVNIIDNPNIIYYNETGFFEDENIVWVVWHWGDKNNNPWNKNKKINKDINKTYINLIHDTINGSTNPNGYKNTSNSNIKENEIEGDYVFLGHIHKQQYL